MRPRPSGSTAGHRLGAAGPQPLLPGTAPPGLRPSQGHGALAGLRGLTGTDGEETRDPDTAPGPSVPSVGAKLQKLLAPEALALAGWGQGFGQWIAPCLGWDDL